MNWADWDIAVAALCGWREARGEGVEGIRGVLHVIKNRATLGKVSWAEVVARPWQFSSMTAKWDPCLIVWPKHPDTEFDACMAFARHVWDGTSQDPTGGATFYFNPSIVRPPWAEKFTKTCSIGHHDFYRP